MCAVLFLFPIALHFNCISVCDLFCMLKPTASPLIARGTGASRGGGTRGRRAARYAPLMYRGVVVVVVFVILAVVVPGPARIWSTDHPASERRLPASAIDSFPNRIRSGEYSPVRPHPLLFSSSPPLSTPRLLLDAGCRRERRDATCALIVARDTEIIISQ